jgi:predicted N-acyltransferase
LSLKVEVLDSIEEIKESKWDNFIEKSSLTSIFHTHRWLKAIEEGTPRVPKHIVVTKSGGILGCMPNFIEQILSLPLKRLNSMMPGHGGPIIIGKEKKVLDAMMGKIDEICGGRILYHCIFTTNMGFVRYVHYLEKRGYRYNVDNCILRIDLEPGWNKILVVMDRTRRYNLKKGLKKNIKIYDSEIEDQSVEKFDEIYRSVMKRVGGPIQPSSLYNQIKRFLGDEARMFLVEKKNELCGGYIAILDRKTDSIILTFGGILEKYLKDNLSEHTIGYAIKWGIKEGYRYVDFGGSKSDFQNGLFKFKEHFGGDFTPVLYWEKNSSMLPLKTLRKVYQIFI